MKKTSKLLDAPLAVTCAGDALVNLTHLEDGDALEAVRRLLDEGHVVFIGVAVDRALRRELLRGVDDAAADLVGRLGPRLRRRRPR